MAAAGRVDKFYFPLDLQTSGDFPLFITTFEELQVMFCSHEFLSEPKLSVEGQFDV